MLWGSRTEQLAHKAHVVDAGRPVAVALVIRVADLATDAVSLLAPSRAWHKHGKMPHKKEEAGAKRLAASLSREQTPSDWQESAQAWQFPVL